MKIELKLGSVTAKEIAEYMGARLFSVSEDALSQQITLFADSIAEVQKNTLFVMDADNSLAEMMAVAKKGALCVLCTQAPNSLEKIPDTAVIVCDNIPEALERFAKQ